MANTFIPLATVTVGAGGLSTITFTAITQTFTDLQIKLSSRTTLSTSVASSVFFTFNSSTVNFGNITFFGNGTSVSSFSESRNAGSQNSGGSTTGIFANINMLICGYATANNKAYYVNASVENNATEAYIYGNNSTWSDGTAISSITLTPNAGNFAEFSTATLYGISKS